MTPTLRPITPTDLKDLHHIYYRAVHEGAAQQYSGVERTAWAPEETPRDDAFLRVLDQHAWIAEIADAQNKPRPVGFITMDARGYIDLLFVLPEVMGHGVADALYAQVLDIARREGLGKLTTHASKLARPFLERRGWRVIASEAPLRHGVSMERFVMEFYVEITP